MPADQQQLGLGDYLWRGLASGTLQIGENIGSLLHFLGATELGSDIEQFFEEAAQPFAMPREIQGSVMDQPELLRDPRWWLYGIGNIAPTIASSLIPAGIAAKLSPAAKAAKAAAIASGISGGLMEGMGSYREARERGFDPTLARISGLASTVGTGLIDALPAYHLFSPLARGGLPGRMLQAGLAEGTTEALEEPWQALVVGRDPIEALRNEGANVFFPAALSGGILGGAAAKAAAPTQNVIELKGRSRIPVPGLVPATTAYEFFTPNQEEHLDWEDAVARIKSPDQQMFKAIAHDIDKKLNLNPKIVDAVGDTREWGTENALFEQIDNVDSLDDIVYSAAWKGKIGNQKGVLGFMSDPKGKDYLYEATIPDHVQNIRQTLDELGIDYRTITPRPNGHGIVVYDEGGKLLDKMEQLGERYDTEIQAHRGIGKLIEAETRDRAQQIYDGIIQQYEKSHPRRYRPPEGILDRGPAEVAYKNAISTADELENRALEFFGRTNDLASAGYIMQDGTLLDLTGSREGGTPGVRAYDHRNVTQTLSNADIKALGEKANSATEQMMEWVRKTKAIRYSPEMNGADIYTDITDNQAKVLAQASRAPDGLVVDVNNDKGYVVASRTFESATPEQIQQFVSNARRGFIPKDYRVVRDERRVAPTLQRQGDEFIVQSGPSRLAGEYMDSSELRKVWARSRAASEFMKSPVAGGVDPQLAGIALQHWVATGQEVPGLTERLQDSYERNLRLASRVIPDRVPVIKDITIDPKDRRVNSPSLLVRSAIKALKKHEFVGMEMSDQMAESVGHVLQNLSTEKVLSTPLPVKTGDRAIQFGRVFKEPALTSPPATEQEIQATSATEEKWFSGKGRYFETPVREPGGDAEIEHFRDKLEFAERTVQSGDETFSLLPPSYDEARVLAKAMDTLQGKGLPLDNVSNVGVLDSGTLGNGTDGMYIPSMNMVLVKKGVVHAFLKNPNNIALQQALVNDVAHEFTHSLDIPASGRPTTSASPLFEIDPMGIEVTENPGKAPTIEVTGQHGSIMDEVLRFYGSDFAVKNGFQHLLSYPLATMEKVNALMNTPVMTPEGYAIRFRDLPDEIKVRLAQESPLGQELRQTLDWIKAETFAQLGALYYAYPKVMQEHLPQAYSMMKEVYDAVRTQPNARARYATVRDVIRSQRPPISDEEIYSPGTDPFTLQGRSRTQTRATVREVPPGAGERGRTAGLRQGPAGDQGVQVYAVKRDEEARHGILSFINKDPNLKSRYGSIERLEGGDLIKALNRMGEQEFADLINEARGGKQAAEQIIALGRVLGKDPKWIRENILERKTGETLNAPGMAAAAQFLVDATDEFAQELEALSQKAEAGTVTDQDYLDFYERMLQQAAVQAQVSGIKSEAGRALGILAHQRSSKPVLSAEEVNAILSQMGGKGQMQDYIDLAKAFVKKGDRGALNNFTEHMLEPRTIDKVFEVWVNSLLSGPPTHVVNMTSNALVSINDDIVRFIAAGIGKLHGGEKVYVREAMTRALASGDAAIKGMKAFWEAIKDEDFETSLRKIEARHRKAIGGVAGKVVRMPGRFLSAEDVLFKEFTFQKELHALAMRRAIANKESYEDILGLTRLPEHQQPPYIREMVEQAHKMAERATFTEELGDIGKAVQRIRGKHPTLAFIVPFVRTPTNIVKYAARHSPLAFLFKDVQADLLAGGAARDIALARIAWGTSLGIGVMMMAAEGLITGGGPEDPRERQILYSQGWQPYSILIGDKYYSYGRLEPLGMIFGISADMREIAEAAGDLEMDELAAMVSGSIFKNITSKTWLRGLTEAMQAVTDPDRYGESWIRNFASTVVPTGIAAWARAEDPVLRRADNIVTAIKRKIPGKSLNVLPRLDMWGRPIRREGGIGPDILSPVYISTRVMDPTAAALREISRQTGWRPGRITKKIAGVELPPEVHNEYIRLARQPAKVMLDALTSSPAWQVLPVEVQREIVEKIVRDTAKRARTTILMTHPEIFMESVKKKVQRVVGG